MKTNKTKHFVLEPEVAGQLGEHTVMDRSTHPPKIEKLHFIFDGWLGDDIVATFPSFLVSKNLYKLLKESELKGFEFGTCLISCSYTFNELLKDTKLPQFYWLKITGRDENADFRLNSKNYLTLSERALNLLKKTKIEHSEIYDINKSANNEYLKIEI